MAVALEDPWLMTQTPVDAEQHGPAGVLGLEFGGQREQVREEDLRRLPGGVVGPEDGQHGVEEEAQRSLQGLQRDVAGEAVGHDDVGRRGQQVPALEVADELEARTVRRLGGEQAVGLLHQRRALRWLLADGEQSHRG